MIHIICLNNQVQTPSFLQSPIKLTVNFVGKAWVLKANRPGSNRSFTTYYLWASYFSDSEFPHPPGKGRLEIIVVKHLAHSCKW